MMRSMIALAAAFCLFAPAIPAAELADREGYFMDEDEEIRMALTAGPESVTADASVYVLRRNGFELVRKGSGEFHCFVERSWRAPHPENEITFDPRVRAPNCINGEGARTVMKEMFKVSGLALQGLSSDEINRRIDAAFTAGELENPSRVALTYMMSKHQWLGERPGSWKPHVMIWSPGLTGAEVGGGNGAFLAGKPGSHRACLVVAVADFIG